MINRIRDKTSSGTRPPAWPHSYKLYDPDNEPQNVAATAGAIPIALPKADFPLFRRTMLKRNPHCFYCGKFVGKHTSDLDHVVPQSRGGTHSPSNLVLSCIACNRHKDADTPAEWLERVTKEFKQLRRLRARLATAINTHDLADLRALPKPEQASKPPFPSPKPLIQEGADPTIDRTAFDLSRPMFSIVRTLDKKRLVSKLRGTDVAHYLEMVGTGRDEQVAIMCEQFWHPKSLAPTGASQSGQGNLIAGSEEPCHK
ncbi:MAG: HNH endonuclease signature motif containing protein [Planctomycetota bacterium]